MITVQQNALSNRLKDGEAFAPSGGTSCRPRFAPELQHDTCRALEWSSMIHHLANQYARNGYRFVPLVVEELSLVCAIHILFLRNGQPGDLISSGDIDNRIKTVVDALTMPTNAGQIGPYKTPGPDQDPFYVLLADDKLVSHLAVETDTMLESVNGKFDPNHARIVITAKIKPSIVSLENLNFA